MKLFSARYCLIAWTGWGMAGAGCANYDPTTSSVPNVTVVKEGSSTGIHIATARLQVMSGEPVVTGMVERRLGYSTAWSHLDVIVTDKAGQVLSRVADTYEPRTIPPRFHGAGGWAYYAIPLPSVPPESIVTVKHHVALLSKCDAINGAGAITP